MIIRLNTNQQNIILAFLLSGVLIASQFRALYLFDIPLLRTPAGVLGGFFVATFILFRGRRFRPTVGAGSLFVLFIFITLLLEIVHIGLNPSRSVEIQIRMYLSFLQLAILTILTIDLARDPRMLFLVWMPFVSFVAYMAIDVLFNFPLFEISSIDASSSALFVINRNELAYQFALGSLSLIWIFFRYPKLSDLRKLILILAAGLMAAAVFKTASRTGFGAYVLGMGVLLFLEFRGRNIRRILTLAPLMLAVLFVISLQFDFLIFRLTATAQGLDFGMRDIIFEASAQMIKEQPFIGYSTSYMYDLGPMVGRGRYAAHSAYLFFLLSFGFVGSLFFILFCIRIAWKLVNNRHLPPCRLQIVLLWTSAMFGLTGNLFGSEVFWILLGLAAVSGRQMLPESMSRRGIQHFLRTGDRPAQPLPPHRAPEMYPSGRFPT